MLMSNNTSLWIVNYKRPNQLQKTVDSWMTSFEFEEINIISNSWPQEYDLGYDNVNIWPNIFRQSWLTGSLTWCWNQAMLHTFESKDWCVMSQDDVEVRYGWDQVINQYDYWTYIAPHGDVIQVQSVDGFNKIGWFDERFRAIGGGEADYLLRMIMEYPEKLSVHDEHIWQMKHNDVGLSNFFINPEKNEHAINTRLNHNIKFADKECFQRWKDKWRLDVDELFLGKYYPLRPNWQEIDWYPAFTQRLIDLNRKDGSRYANCL